MGMRRRPLARAAVVGESRTTRARGGRRTPPQSSHRTSRSQISRRSSSTRRRLRPLPAPSAGSGDMVAQLESLKKLLDEGILTQAEFDMQKQKLLAGS